MRLEAPRDRLREMFDAAVRAADPMTCVPAHAPSPPRGRTIVIGAGKASAAMARALEQCWPGHLSGTVVTPYGHSVDCKSIEVLEAAHPVPDTASIAASRRILEQVFALSPQDLVICLLSGGGSSVMTLPAPGLTLRDKQSVNAALLRSGATISEFNAVRKHISAIKGGRLAEACHPARLITLAISDVPGDDPSVIASGPTTADATTSEQARSILHKFGIRNPAIKAHLSNAVSETLKPANPIFGTTEFEIVASPMKALESAAAAARSAGIKPIILGDAIQGEARTLARSHAALALEKQKSHAAPVVLLSGGETTVKVTGTGTGGRNSEYLLSLLIALDSQPNIHALAADTDGIDGNGASAGAIIGPDTLERAHKLGLDAVGALEANDSHSFFNTLQAAIVTGPTHTNVNDFRAILIG